MSHVTSPVTPAPSDISTVGAGFAWQAASTRGTITPRNGALGGSFACDVAGGADFAFRAGLGVKARLTRAASLRASIGNQNVPIEREVLNRIRLADAVAAHLNHPDFRVRAQVARLCGELGVPAGEGDAESEIADLAPPIAHVSGDVLALVPERAEGRVDALRVAVVRRVHRPLYLLSCDGATLLAHVCLLCSATKMSRNFRRRRL